MRGVRIISSAVAVKASSDQLFPASRHRSARIRKKLIKRFGGEFRQVPTIYRYGNDLIAHPTLYDELVKAAALSSTTPEQR